MFFNPVDGFKLSVSNQEATSAKTSEFNSESLNKVQDILKDVFNSELFRQTAGLLGHIAVAVGSSFLTQKLSSWLGNTKVPGSEMKADFVVNAAINQSAEKAKEKIVEDMKLKPLSPEIYRAIFNYQQDAINRELSQRTFGSRSP